MEVVGHRGAAALAPENTIPGFELSSRLGVPWIELDIRPTKDGELVVIHDKNLERTTDGKGDVNELTLEEIQSVDAGSWFSPAFAGVHVPTLGEVLERFHNRLNINIELKEPEDRLEEQIARLFELLDKYQLRHRVILSSFKENILKELREQDERLRLAIISSQSADTLKRVATELNCEFINANVRLITEKLVTWAHERERKVTAWLANEPELVHLFSQVHVDMICTDNPKMALECLGKES